MKIILSILTLIIFELGFILLYISSSKKIYLANSKKNYIILAIKSILLLLIPVILLDQLFYYLFWTYTEGLYWTYVVLATIGIIIKPIIIDIFYGDIIHDYYFSFNNENLLKFKYYMLQENTLYGIKKICQENGMRAFSISAYQDNNSSKLFLIDRRYYVLIDRENRRILNKIDIYDIQKKNVNEIKSLSEYIAIINQQFTPFEIFIRFEMQNNRILDLEISIKEDNNNILVESSKTLKRAK